MRRPFATVAMVALAAGVLFAMQRGTPRYQDLTGPIPAYGKMGKAASTRLFDIRVERVEFARQLVGKRFGGEIRHESAGVWAIVTARMAARSRSVNVTHAVWEGPTGLRYELSDRPEFLPDLPPHTLEPGLPQRGRFVFEIRPDQILGATLLVSEGPFPRLDSEAHVALNALPAAADGLPPIAETFDLQQAGGRP
ncbi:hypothetical protein [Pigmentiphaga sp. H8]|uniref:hypothetical protein n=1 Tax=Pigmentiphaga sp. H8 TaxID=2488560 RepID=UPI001EE0CE2F|nr:hypothetical protein [Pigmentiphaga sp. H8]